MNFKKILTLLLAAFFLACNSPKMGVLSKKQKQNWYLSIEETACFGKCPIYTLKADGYGTAMLDAKRFMEPLGSFSSSLEDTTMASLVSLAAHADWKGYDSVYASGYSDLPSTIVRYSIQPGDTHTVKYESDLAPEPIVAMANSLKTFRKKTKWNSEVFE